MYLYNVAFFAMKFAHMKYGSVLIWADNLQEAKGYGLEFVKQKCAIIDGWSNHSVEAHKLDDTVIERAFYQLHPDAIIMHSNSSTKS